MVMCRLLLLGCLALPLPAWAVEPIHFALVPEKSEIRFEAVQNNAPVKGGFNGFSGDIAFHPDALPTSHTKIMVDIGSVFADYDEVAETLKTADWFDNGGFPQAVLETESFTALGDNRYEAVAALTIKGQRVPVTLHFTVNSFSDTQANVTGEAILKRTDFNIGWQDTATVADEVKVTFSVFARAE